jgi:hypothetical protein
LELNSTSTWVSSWVVRRPRLRLQRGGPRRLIQRHVSLAPLSPLSHTSRPRGATLA